MKKNFLWIGGLCLILLSVSHAYAKPIKMCVKDFRKTVKACNDEEGKALEKCVEAKYKALYECLNDDAEFKDEDKGEAKFKKAFDGFYKRVDAALAVCHRYTDEDKDECLNGTYKESLRDLSKTVKKHFAKKKGRSRGDTDVDKEVGDCEGILKKKALECNEKDGDKVYKCLRKQYDAFYRCVVKDVNFKAGKKDEKKFKKEYNRFYGRVEDAVKICQRYSRSKMEKCLKATHKAALKDFKGELKKIVGD